MPVLPALLLAVSMVLVSAGEARAGVLQPPDQLEPAPAASARNHPVVRRFLALVASAKRFRGKVRVKVRKGEETAQMVLDLALEKPDRTAYTILSADRPRSAEGTRIVWFGEDDVHVRTRFFGFPLSITLPLQDPRLMDLRGDDNRSLAITRVFEQLERPDCRLGLLPPGRWQQRSVTGLWLDGPGSPRGITHQVFWLDDADGMPRVREMYEGDKAVYRLDVLEGTVDGALPPDHFRP
ncbi:MAG: hypothetical protein VKP57_04810 [Candidatus Sericytochromatia bacterium]|nr:hypothetical protein [Candidatus Sericytochromatia bacterium]